MSVCEVCGGVTADHGRHLKWHRTMSNIPPVGRLEGRDVLLTDIRVAYRKGPWHDFGHPPESTPIHDALVAESTVRDFIALGEERRPKPGSVAAFDEGMRRLTAALRRERGTLT